MTAAPGPDALLRRLRETCPEPALRALDACRRACRDAGTPLFLVGGATRDLLLERPGFDLDLSVEGDAVAVARAVAAETGGRAVTHDRFGTARVTGPGFRIDLARTRRETYPHPGALPVVEPATLAEDLARRDFTVNAIALRLEPEPPALIDPFRGAADIQASLIRVLHDRSFQDDATRMLRAVRYAARLGFKIATQTEALVRRDLSYLGTISGPRLRTELALLFQDPAAAVAGTLLAQRLGVLQAIHPALRLQEPVAERWEQALAGERHAPLDELGFCVVAHPGDEGTAASVSKWLHLTGRIEHALADLVRLEAQSSKLEAMSRPSEATELLDRYTPAAVWALAVLRGGKTGQTCLDYLGTWRHVRPELSGDDLLALGMPAGPRLGEALRALRAARLDGEASSREQELALVRGQL